MLSKLLGGSLVDTVGKVIDSVHTSEEEKGKIKIRLQELENEINSKQKPKTPKKEGMEIESLGPILEAKDGGSVEGKRLTRTVPPKKGPNSQGMRGTGAAIRGTKFKGVF